MPEQKKEFELNKIYETPNGTEIKVEGIYLISTLYGHMAVWDNKGNPMNNVAKLAGRLKKPKPGQWTGDL